MVNLLNARLQTPVKVETNRVAEFTFASASEHPDPFNTVELDALFTAPDGSTRKVPGFWAGGRTWKVRYSSGLIGRHRFKTVCSDSACAGLNGVAGEVVVTRYSGEDPLYLHGPPKVAPDRRHFQYADGKPFFWLADTWWMGLCKRLHFPDEFAKLAGDRVKKGFTVVQIVAGLYPDMGPFDERGANEFGFPWKKDYSAIEPGYFDQADRRIAYLCDHGLAPCIVGAWGYHMPWMGVERLKKHWRYLVARWGAYPVFWCVAGEVNLPYYLTPGFPFDDRKQASEWTKVTAYLKQIDPYHRPLSTHPTGIARLSARPCIDPSVIPQGSGSSGLLDFDMLQTGHGDRSSLAPTVDTMQWSYAQKPVMPVLDSEVCYEGILNSCHDDVQRLMFWSCILNGAAGHTYGANGIWQQNRPGEPYGKSPHGGTYGPTPWNEAMRLPGSGQLGLAKKFLETLPWQKLQPKPELARFLVQGSAGLGGSWIWYPEGNPAVDAPTEKRYFRRTFALPPGYHSPLPLIPTLAVSADDKFTLYVNGSRVGSHLGWNRPQSYDVSSYLRAGRNVIAIEAENLSSPVAKNPAGLICSLRLAGPRPTEVMSIQTGPDWRCSKTTEPGWAQPEFDDSKWQRAIVIAEYGGGPWGKVDAEDKYLVPYAAVIPGERAVLYVPDAREVLVKLDNRDAYRVTYYNPISGRKSDGGPLKHSIIRPPAGASDWVVLLKRSQK